MGTVDDVRSISRSNIVCLEGNGVRPSHRGDGWSQGGAMYTLNSTEVHAVAYQVYDARGNGDGGVSPTLTGDHQNRITDYTAIVLEIHDDSDAEKILRCENKGY